MVTVVSLVTVALDLLVDIVKLNHSRQVIITSPKLLCLGSKLPFQPYIIFKLVNIQLGLRATIPVIKRGVFICVSGCVTLVIHNFENFSLEDVTYQKLLNAGEKNTLPLKASTSTYK